jgi:hypothetical protein
VIGRFVIGRFVIGRFVIGRFVIGPGFVGGLVVAAVRRGVRRGRVVLAGHGLLGRATVLAAGAAHLVVGI